MHVGNCARYVIFSCSFLVCANVMTLRIVRAIDAGADPGFLKRGFKCTKGGFVCVILNKIY